jgi:hypothetical protein
MKTKIRSVNGEVAYVTPVGRFASRKDVIGVRDALRGLIGSDYSYIFVDSGELAEVDRAVLRNLVRRSNEFPCGNAVLSVVEPLVSGEAVRKRAA